MKLDDYVYLYPSDDIDKVKNLTQSYLTWLMRQPWWSGMGNNVVSSEGGYDAMTNRAMAYALEADDYRAGLNEFGNSLMRSYRYHEGEFDTSYTEPMEDRYDSDNVSAQVGFKALNRESVPSAEDDYMSLAGELEASFAVAASESYSYTTVRQIIVPPYNEACYDMLITYANTRSYVDTAAIHDCEWEEVRRVIGNVTTQMRRYPTPEKAAGRRRSTSEHIKRHKRSPDRWCYWCSV